MTRPLAETLHTLSLEADSFPSWRRVRLGADGPDLKEAWLRDRVAATPELVLGPCRAFGLLDEEEWRPWCVEMNVAGVGSVDVALVSADGRVALVEVKLARNPEIRRKVVAQLLDYAIHLREAAIEDLPTLPTVAGAPFVDADDVQRHLHEGDFLLIVAADAADERAAKLTRAMLDRHAIHPWDLAIVDLALFAPTGSNDPRELLCVPHLVGGVVCESRHVVEVRVSNPGEKTTVTLGLAPPESVERSVRQWDLESFRTAFDQLAVDVDYKREARAFIDEVEARRPSSIRGSRRTKYPVVVVQNGEILFMTIARNALWLYGQATLAKAFGDASAARKWAEVRAIFPEVPASKPYFGVKASDRRAGEALALVRGWLGVPRR